MSMLLLLVGGLSLLLGNEDRDETQGHSVHGAKHLTKHELHLDFYRFRRRYMVVYSIIMLADWMQGTHMCE